MALPRATTRTSSAPQHPPFKVEVVNSRDILCYVGRVFEPLSSEAYGQSVQKSWDATQGKYTGKGLPNTRAGKIELRYHNYNVKTGSAIIHYNGTSTTASQGRSTYATATQEVGEDGYVRWLRSSAPADNYIVLHREVDAGNPTSGYWCISAVGSGGVLESDIVIAYIRDNTTVRQIWKSDVAGSPAAENSFPFKVTSDGDKISVVTGAVHNIVCEIVTIAYPVGIWYVYATASGWTGYVPTAASIQIVDAVLTDTDEVGYLLLGQVEIATGPPTVTQIAGGSQWLDRFKCGSNGTASYYWSKV